MSSSPGLPDQRIERLSANGWLNARIQLEREIQVSSSRVASFAQPGSRVRAGTAITVLTVVIFAVYLWFDLREGMRGANLATTRLASIAKYERNFGLPYAVGMLGLDLMLAFASATMMHLSFVQIRQRRRAGSSVGSCAVGSSVIMGWFAFGCPTCPLPILNTLGTTFFAASLPLYGLEFKLLALVVVVASYLWLRRRSMAVLNPQADVITA
jgi:hypothetical protein